ncbi:MAG: hypothetical protein K6A62_04675 [Bacteroidales bacterium]|nr:hypothetical protein [Bacteroidales bacterium]
MDNLLEFPELERILRDYADYFRNDYEQRLIGHDRYASGGLLDSIRTNIQVGETGYTVTVTLKEYWKYVEEDTRPHWPPPQAILRWVEIKPTLPRPYVLDGKEISPKSLAYLIGRKISRVGTKGTHDMAEAKADALNAFRADLKRALGHDVVNYILKVKQ